MFTAIDHIIIGVNNLEEAAEAYSKKLGLVASGGGVHPAGGTANRIIVIDDTYLELITVDRPAEASRQMLERMTKGNGYLNFVLASDNIETDTALMAQQGIAVFGPVAGQLRAANGQTRGWQRTDIERTELAQHYPFLIQHDSVGEERRFRLAGWQTPPEHHLGAVKVLSTTIAVQDLHEASQRFAHIYGLEPSEPFQGDVGGSAAKLVSFRLGQSGQTFELAAPSLVQSGDSSGEDQFPDFLNDHLRTFGESLCRMTLAVRSPEAARQYLDAQSVTSTYREVTEPELWVHPNQAYGAHIVLRQILQ